MVEEIVFRFWVLLETGERIETLSPSLALEKLAHCEALAWLPCIVVTCQPLDIYRSIRHSGDQRRQDVKEVYNEAVHAFHRKIGVPRKRALPMAERLVKHMLEDLERLEHRLEVYAMRGVRRVA